MQLSKTYFEKFHAMYNIKRPNQPTSHVDDKHMLAIVQRCLVRANIIWALLFINTLLYSYCHFLLVSRWVEWPHFYNV